MITLRAALVLWVHLPPHAKAHRLTELIEPIRGSQPNVFTLHGDTEDRHLLGTHVI